MNKVISFRVTDSEFDLFRQLAAADNRTLSAYFKHLAHKDSYKTGARTHSTIARQHPGSTTSTVTLPVKTHAMPSASTMLGSLFDDDAFEGAAEAARLAEERRRFEEGDEPPDDML